MSNKKLYFLGLRFSVEICSPSFPNFNCASQFASVSLVLLPHL